MNLEAYLKDGEANGLGRRMTHAEFAALFTPPVHVSMVAQWLTYFRTGGRQGRPVSPKRALQIETLTHGRVDRYTTCPHIFKHEPGFAGEEVLRAAG